jgi:N-acetylglucosamine kinase-like BadF-type ATPase
MIDQEVLVLGVDGGGSKLIVLLADAHGRIVGRGEARGANLQAAGEENARHALLSAVQMAFKHAKIPRQKAAVICLGWAGVGRPEDSARVRAWMDEEDLAQKVLVNSDSLLLLWAGTAEGWGIGLVCGTGSIAFGRTKEGKTARAGGWGYRLGDEGSGFAMGSAALNAITQAADGRGPETTLTDRILQNWSLDSPQDLIRRMYQQDADQRQVASLAPLVLAAAREGDEVALRIIEKAACDLAFAVAAVHRQLAFPTQVPGAFGGGVLVNDPWFARMTRQAIEDKSIHLDPLQVVAEPVMGAIRLALNAL